MASIDGVLRAGSAGGRGDAWSGRAAGTGGAPASRPFSEVLKEAVAQVNALQIEAQKMAEAAARGEVSDMHTVALALERAQLALELTVAVRNKLVEAYQEISRMPI